MKAKMAEEFYDLLDMTLPPDLRNVVRFEPVTACEAKQPAEAGDQGKRENKMSQNANTTPHVDKKAVAAIVKSIVSKLDNEKAVAAQVEDLTTQRLSAETQRDQLKQDLEKAQASIESLKTEHAEAIAAKDEQIKKLEAEKSEASKKVGEVEKQLAEANKRLAEIEVEKTVANRTAALKELGEAFATEDRIKMATARKEDGSFKMSDEAFTIMVETAKAFASLKPADAADSKTDSKTDSKDNKAEASQGEDKADESGKDQGQAPDQPDLSVVEAYQKAISSLAQVSKPQSTGRALYARLGRA